MKYTEAQVVLERLSRSLYDDSPEKTMLTAARAALAFVNDMGSSRVLPAAIPAKDLLARFWVEVEAVNVDPPCRDISKDA